MVFTRDRHFALMERIVGAVTCCCLLLITLPAFAAEKGCSEREFSERIKAYQRVIAKEEESRASWYELKLSANPNIVIDAVANPICAAFFEPGKGWKAIPLKTKISPQTAGDNYFLIGTSEQTLDGTLGELQIELNAHSDKPRSSFVYILGHPWQDPPDKKYAQKASEMPSPIATSMSVAIHEAFHLLVQNAAPFSNDKQLSPDCRCSSTEKLSHLKLSDTFAQVSPELFGPKSWPDLGSRAEDEELQSCYIRNENVRSIHRQEMKALGDAMSEQNEAKSKALTRKYIQLRTQRYAINPTFAYRERYNDPQLKQENCKIHEAKQELYEGVPQFVGNALIVDQKLSTEREVATQFVAMTDYFIDHANEKHARPITSYYHAGAASLHLIRRFYKGDFLDLTRKISAKDANYNLTDLLESIVGK
ncbi:MAG: hypothetical protein EOP06_06375 [Proteobacteria bacterium]|nr:MAG: hypothetical protein EOP06_06375 [Pseudomonadota bacterium]